MRRRIAALSAALVMLALSACGEAAFNGSRVKNEDEYIIECSILNGEDSHTMLLAAGDVLSVEIVSEAGEIDLSIMGRGGENAFRGTELGSCQFEVGILESGEYEISLTGRRARGKVSVRIKK